MFKLLKQIRSWNRWQRRQMDRDLLWPSFVAISDGDYEHAVQGFMIHACIDEAWCGEMFPEEAEAIVRTWPYKSTG